MIIKNLSMICEITNSISSEPVRYIVNDHIIKFNKIDDYTFNKSKHTKVFINGDWIGYSLKPDILMKTLQHNRDNGVINLNSSGNNILDNTNNVKSKIINNIDFKK